MDGYFQLALIWFFLVFSLHSFQYRDKIARLSNLKGKPIPNR